MRTSRSTLTVALLLVLAATLATASTGQQSGPATIEVTPGELTVEVGDTAQISAVVKDAAGNVLEDATVLFFSFSRRSLAVTPSGRIEAHAPGEFFVLARVPADPESDSRRGEALVETRIPVTVPWPPIASVELAGVPDRWYAGTSVRPEVLLTDASGARRDNVDVRFESSDPGVAAVTPVGRISLIAPGSATITATAEAASARLELTVEENPVTEIRLQIGGRQVRTGDVVHLDATALDADGREVPEVPVEYTFRARTVEHDLGEPPSGLMTGDGRFVADIPGEYVLMASAGTASAMETIWAEPRNVRREIELVGHARVSDRATSDLWVWEAPDGRDYAITGTHRAEGHAYIWEVTDPRDMVMIDTVRVDARTVNDVKVSDDGRICVISREGASNRRNGLVILDCSNPSEGVSVLARYDDQLTGGVHNVFVYEDHVFALSAGDRYDIINIEDPTNPYRVGRFELETPGHSIHDVWVQNGIAFSSNWDDGVVAVDVGGGGQGGAPNNPVMLGKYAYPSGWNHAAYPYWSESAGKFYVFAGDESGRRGNTPGYEGEADRMNGWIHVIEWDEWDRPREVARYEVPEVGTHNLWVEDDIMYVAYYQGGLRVVDVSGELLGDLYRQGREIGYFLPYDPEGFVPNSPFVWGPQPFKGNIFFSDYNSGLWAVRLAEPEDTTSQE